MAGHSKWANIRHRKAKQDKVKGKMWTKCARAIIVAARNGADPAMNLALRYAIDEARACNMPKDNIQRAIDKGSGAGAAENYEPASYEAYGPAGVAIIIDALTDNKTRTVTEVRNILRKAGCTLGTTGSVSYMFQPKGQILIDAAGTNEETVMTAAIEAGAEDVQPPEGDGDAWTIITDPTQFIAVKEALERAGLEPSSAELTKLPGTMQSVGGEEAQALLTLIENLEDNDDVQKVYTNADIDEQALAGL